METTSSLYNERTLNAFISENNVTEAEVYTAKSGNLYLLAGQGFAAISTKLQEAIKADKCPPQEEIYVANAQDDEGNEYTVAYQKVRGKAIKTFSI